MVGFDSSLHCFQSSRLLFDTAVGWQAAFALAQAHGSTRGVESYANLPADQASVAGFAERVKSLSLSVVNWQMDHKEACLDLQHMSQ